MAPAGGNCQPAVARVPGKGTAHWPGHAPRWGLGPLAFGIPVLGGDLLAAAQAQARLAESGLDAGQAFFTCPLGEELAGDFHSAGKVARPLAKRSFTACP